MSDLKDGETTEMQGSGKKPYTLKNIGGVYSCSCPAWRNQSLGIDARTCKHLKKLRGAAVEEARIGTVATPPVAVAELGRKPAVKKDTAPELLLAHKWDNEQDLTGWWISEKLDGVRAYWDGTNFISRLGNILHAPEWFKKGLPSYALDGELWVGRGQFQRCVSIVRRHGGGLEWEEVKYLIFDKPGSSDPFEQRCSQIADWVAAAKPRFATTVAQTPCEGLAHIALLLAEVNAAGGEGLMCRAPGSLYEGCRSNTLLKVKTFFDEDALVLEYQNGKGRHKGRVGALNVRLKNGTEFKVGTGFSDAQREAPPAIGSIITFRYQELTNDGVPRFPSFVGERVDVKW